VQADGPGAQQSVPHFRAQYRRARCAISSQAEWGAYRRDRGRIAELAETIRAHL
jgi:hypothetical protein